MTSRDIEVLIGKYDPLKQRISRSSIFPSVMEEFDKLYDSFISGFMNTSQASAGKGKISKLPKVNIYRKGGKYVIDSFIPMASKEDISLDIDENILKISVDAHHDETISDDDYMVREISRGQMTRYIALENDVNPDTAKSSYKDGVLRIEFDLKTPVEEPNRKKIVIE